MCLQTSPTNLATVLPGGSPYHVMSLREIKEEPSWTYLGGKPAQKGSKEKRGKCTVCEEEASGVYFGALVCLPCKVSGT